MINEKDSIIRIFELTFYLSCFFLGLVLFISIFDSGILVLLPFYAFNGVIFGLLYIILRSDKNDKQDNKK